MKTNVLNVIKGTMAKAVFQVKKHSPEILIVAGVVGTVASAVMACKATTKVSEIVTDAKNNIDKIHDCAADQGLIESGKYSKEDAKKDLTIVYAQTGLKLIKLYAPSVILGALSLTVIVASNQILRKRNIGLAAAYATIDKSFKDYRKKVVDRFGEKVDRELRHNIKAVEIENTIVDENGKEQKVKEIIEVVENPYDYSDYAKIFDELNPYYERNSEYNRMFLTNQQSHANDLLRANGYLFLNEVYEMVGAPTTAYGQIAGWVYTEDSSIGDNFVDFGIFDVTNENACDFVNGRERSIILDFNCIGNILEYI